MASVQFDASLRKTLYSIKTRCSSVEISIPADPSRWVSWECMLLVIMFLMPNGQRFVLAKDSLQLVLPDVDLQVKLLNFCPPKPMHYLTNLYFSGVYKNLHTDFDFSRRQAAIFGFLGAKPAQYGNSNREVGTVNDVRKVSYGFWF